MRKILAEFPTTELRRDTEIGPELYLTDLFHCTVRVLCTACPKIRGSRAQNFSPE